MAISLTATKREVVGKRVRGLRRNGIVPCQVYGKTTKNFEIQVSEDDIKLALKAAGTTRLITLSVDGKTYPVLAREIVRTVDQKHFVHVDFFAVDSDTPVRAVVPLVVKGDSPLVAQGGVLVTPVSTLKITCLPKDLPESLEIDAASLASFKDLVTAGNIKVPAGIKVTTGARTTLAYVSQTRATKAAEEAAKAATAPAAKGKAPAKAAPAAAAKAPAKK